MRNTIDYYIIIFLHYNVILFLYVLVFLSLSFIMIHCLSVDSTSLPWMLYVAAFGPIAGFLALCILIVCCCLCYIKCAKKKGR